MTILGGTTTDDDDHFMGDDDEVFIGYISTTNDPGPILLIGTLIICILLNVFLPCFVACGKHYQKRKAKQQQAKDPWINPIIDDDNEVTDDNKAPSIRSISDMSIIPGEEEHHTGRSRVRRQTIPSETSDKSGTSSILNPSVMNGGAFGKRSRIQRRFRRAMEKQLVQIETGNKMESFFHFDNTCPPPSSHHQHNGDNIDDLSCLSKMDTDEHMSIKSLPPQNNNAPNNFALRDQQFDNKNNDNDNDDDIQITCCGIYAWWKPYWFMKSFNKLITLSEWDFEMKVHLYIQFI